jgi:hypothetical protein
MFELTTEEWQNLKFQFGTSSWGGTRYPPFAFTEQGVAMLSTVLDSKIAIQVNIGIMRAFVALRHLSMTYAELAQKITELEANLGKDLSDINEVLRWLGEENQTRADEIRQLQHEQEEKGDWKNRNPIGFKSS